ncbi:sugar phosphate isomerase/epimerase family protein [Spirosoma soli]|uniref:Sugar phosphate isomerase/epimerase family protein n=1 Tax=Spirosoma soli TaxID=1770529 RepID=A0ABW5MG50_9BACT
MQLGISTYTYGWAVGVPGDRPEQPLDEHALFDRANAFTLRVVQFGDNWPLHALPANRLEALKQRADREDIVLEVGARGLTDARLQQYIALADTLKSKLLRFVIDEPNYEPLIEDVISLVRNAVPALEKAGITLGLENHDRLLAREFAHIVEQVGSNNIGICLDSVNSMGAGEGLAEVVRTLAPYTVNLHLKDFGIRRLPHQMGFQIDGRPAGQGLLNVPWLVEQIIPYERCRTAILEQWVVPEPNQVATIAKEVAWADESMAYLQQTGLFKNE